MRQCGAQDNCRPPRGNFNVSKAKALEAVAVFAPDQVTRLSKLKKGDLASEAGRLAAGSGWLPAILCAPSPLERAEAASPVDASSADEDGESGQE
jgi:ParB family chromosome partitioning protein